MARPTGTVTFLFSDIEGSTARWEANSDAMASAVARHDALMRARLEAHGAYIFKTVGDAFCAAFDTAPRAMAAAIDAQRTLEAENFSAIDGLRLRMALHTGTADERDGDYFGPTVNRVARLTAIGHGGQVLISEIVAELLQNDLPPESSLRDLGAHRLKDLTGAERVYQLLAPGLQESFPPLRSLDRLSNNLPLQLTTFVGRDEVLAEVKTLIEHQRLVTLTGAGGAGKTRCALQAGAELLDGLDEGVWLAELAPISDPALVAKTIAQALNVREQPNRPMLDTLLAYLKRKRLLLILDNCEHVIEEARRVAGAILENCPDVYILVTSREPLNIAGEEAYRMPSLSVPSDAEALFQDGTARYGAVQLFVDRAISSDRRFVLSEANAPDVAEICRRLDGIPLAIELAAARIKVLSPKQLVQKLDERFRVLTGGDRRALPRQQTMRALIDWSYDLLSDEERSLFRKLSIFAGGFTLETAAAVCEDEMDEIAVLDLLSSLVDKSLVQAEPIGSETRYRLLESTRQYAREKLIDAGEAEPAAHAHAHTFLAVAEQLAAAWDSMQERAWHERAKPELENLRAALSWAFGSSGDILLGQRIAGVLRQGLWNVFGWVESRHWVQAAQEHVTADTPTAVLAALDLAEAFFATAVTQYKASLRAGERGLARYREVDDSVGITEAQGWVGRAQILLGEIAEGEARLRQAVQSARALGRRRSVIFGLESLAFARQFAGDLAGARQYYSEALAAAQATGAEQYAAQLAMNLGETEFRGGDADAALRLARESIEGYRAFANAGGIANAQSNLAAYLLALSRFDEAREAARAAVGAARDAQFSVYVAFALQHLGAAAALHPSFDVQDVENRSRTARIVGYVDARLTALEAVREDTEQLGYAAMISALRDALGEDELSKLMAEGGTWSEDRAVAEAMQI